MHTRKPTHKHMEGPGSQHAMSPQHKKKIPRKQASNNRAGLQQRSGTARLYHQAVAVVPRSAVWS